MWIFVCAVTFACYLWKQWWDNTRLPPGPTGLPILGCLPFFKSSVEYIKTLADKYGPIFSVRLGNKLVVFLNDYDVVKEAFVTQGEIFAGRPDSVFPLVVDKPKGVVWTEGEQHKLLRRFTLSSMRDFGLGKLSTEGKIHEELEHLFDEFQALNQKPFDPLHLLTNAVSNITCNIVFGRRFDYSDPGFKALIEFLSKDLLASQATQSVVTVLPWLSYLPSHRRERAERLEKQKVVWTFVRDQIEEHKSSRVEGEPPRDFLDAMLDEAAKEQAAGKVFEEHLLYTITQLFIAGTETTATTLQWALWVLLKHPEIQTQLQQHLDQQLGSTRLTSWEQDKSKLPLVESFALEVQRVGNIAKTSLPHSTTKDTMLRGYYLPARSLVYANLTEIHQNEKLWPNNEDFVLDRFVKGQGVNSRAPGFVPFSIGKRVCLGETLARMELFMFVGGLLQRYNFTKPEGVKIEEGRCYGLTVHPKPYQIIATPRND